MPGKNNWIIRIHKIFTIDYNEGSAGCFFSNPGQCMACGQFIHFGFYYGAALYLFPLNHWLKPGKGKEFFFNVDQIAIFMLIAGIISHFLAIFFSVIPIRI